MHVYYTRDATVQIMSCNCAKRAADMVGATVTAAIGVAAVEANTAVVAAAVLLVPVLPPPALAPLEAFITDLPGAPSLPPFAASTLVVLMVSMTKVWLVKTHMSAAIFMAFCAIKAAVTLG